MKADEYGAFPFGDETEDSADDCVRVPRTWLDGVAEHLLWSHGDGEIAERIWEDIQARLGRDIGKA